MLDILFFAVTMNDAHSHKLPLSRPMC